MFDKYKRYRQRQLDGRIAVKLEFKFYLRRVSGLPRHLAEVQASLSREDKVIELRKGQVEAGETHLARPWHIVYCWNAAFWHMLACRRAGYHTVKQDP
jgi:hypothetical protein